MVSLLTRWLLDQGERPAILSRGYGRRDRCDGVVVVSDGGRVLTGLDQAGDEPLMLARSLSGAVVVVGEDRFLAGTLAERRLHATVHLLDDGFQHVQLARDVDILMTTTGEITGGRVLPMGRLREPVDAAARADVLVVLDSDTAAARAEAWALGISQVASGRRVLERATESAPAVVAVAGIASPDGFFKMLRTSGYRLAESLSFRDHHPYTRSDVARINAAVQAAGGAPVVTTEKDYVRLEPLAPWPFECHATPMTLSIDGWDDVVAFTAQAIARRREPA